MYLILSWMILVAMVANSVWCTSVRLVNGNHPWEGTVQIFHSGWGTVCDDDFGVQEANVICRMLGYYGSRAIAYSSAHFGQGSGNILLDDLKCTGRETDIADCVSKGWGQNNCGHSEDAGVRCGFSSASLVGGQGNYEGIVNTVNGTICDKNFTDNDAIVICRLMGFTKGVAVVGSKFGQLNHLPIKGMDLRCRGNEAHLESCPGYSHGWGTTTGCNHSMDAGVICDHTPVRLVDGVLPSDGRLEVLRNGVWGTVCGSSFGRPEATVVCHMLGFDSSTSTISHNAHGGSGPVWFNDLSCHGNESDISYCSHGSLNNSCDHSNDIGLKCTPTDVRLTGGTGPWEGTVEIFRNGNWGTVCDPHFGDKEADVVCRMLGYTGKGAPHTIYHSNYYKYSGNIRFDSVRCQGDEHDISQCYNVFHRSCPSGTGVGLKCEGVQVRLEGGAHSSEGRVEILHGGVWGTICDDNWDDMDATVICRMMTSFPYDSSVSGTAIPGSHFGYGTGPVYMSKVACNGSESGISNCHADLTGGINCDHSRDAGVLCEFNSVDHIVGDHWTGIIHDQTMHIFCPDGWGNSDADVVCKEIGYINPKAVLYNNSNHLPRHIQLDPACKGNEGHIEMCELKKSPVPCSSSYSIGVRCHPQDIGRDGIRLVDGPGPWKGRLEVLSNGNWGSFSYNVWNDTYNDLVCYNLNYTNPIASSYSTSKGLTSLLYHSMECDTPDTNIGHCRMDYNVTECSTACSSVGIDCSGGVTAKLSNETTMSGQVKFYTGNRTQPWSVCYDGIDNSSAAVICSMAGFSNTSPVITSVSSQDQVLFSSLQCQGWESHIGQCQTFENNTSCDDKAAVSCFECIATYTKTSGSVYSRNYPSFYLPNKDCLIVITPSTNKPLKLIFHDLQLAGDGDFVEIRDGAHGKQLGYFSTSTVVPVMTSRSGFYIRFKTNSAGNGRGFNVTWSPLQIDDAISMGCGQDGWDVGVNTTILRQLYPDTGVSQVKLSDQLCIGKIDGDMLLFRQSYTECSTMSKDSSTNVLYINNLLYPEATSPFPLIVHGYRWKVEVECDISRGQTVVSNFHPNQTIGHQSPHQSHHLGSSSNYQSTVKFFSSGSFYKQITGNPVTLKTGDDVFVQVKMDSKDTHVKMVLDTCYAKPSSTADKSQTYTLINNGCVVDPDTRILSQGTHETRFVFNAFEFPTNHNDVYVYCNTTYCHVTDTSSTCSQTCHGSRPGLVGREIPVLSLQESNEEFD